MRIYLLSDQKVDGAISLPMLTVNYLPPTSLPLGYEALILTSRHALTSLTLSNLDWRQIPAFCVGKKTAKRVEQEGGVIGGIAPEGVGEQLLIPMRESGFRRFWWPSGRDVATDIVTMAKGEGFEVIRTVVYETRCTDTTSENQRPLPGSTIIFTSPKTAHCFLERYGWEEGWRAVAIGPTTLAALPDSLNASLSPKPDFESAVAWAMGLLKRVIEF
ncbi:MAG: uroporphyrinogen-III synthase [Campylobacterales bacterium]